MNGLPHKYLYFNTQYFNYFYVLFVSEKFIDIMEKSKSTDSPNFTGIQKNINGLSDPSRVELAGNSTQIVQPTEDNELQPIINNKKNGIFENVSIHTI